MKIIITLCTATFYCFIANCQNVGIGAVAPSAKLEITHNGASTFGTALLLNQTAIGNSDGPKIQFQKTMAVSKSWTAGILNGVNVGAFTINEDGSFNGYGTNRFTIAPGGNIGIGNNAPNAPLSFPASLGKKITLYPGATGDVGFGVAGNRLQIYSDNPNADVALGYDAAGTFNERFAVKPNGALAVNGNTGQAGQELVSIGSGSAATWVNRPSVIYFNRSGGIALDGSVLCNDIGGINGQSFSLGSNSLITYQFSIPLFASNGTFGGASTGAVSIQVLNNVGTIVSQANSQFEMGNYVSRHVVITGVGDLSAGIYTIRARVVRNNTGNGATYDNYGPLGGVAGCNDISVYPGQLIIQVFPK